MASREASSRINLTLTKEEASRLAEYATSIERRPTTVARELLLAALTEAGGKAGEALTVLQRRYQEVQRERDDLLRKLDAVFEGQRPPADAGTRAESPDPEGTRSRRPRRGEPEPARWELPVEELLADTTWWDRWLPRLYELLGRDLRGEPEGEDARWGGQGKLVVDARGYGDLLNYLFPAVGAVTWRSPDYPTAGTEEDRQGAHEGTPPSVQAHVWEPVLRHVAKALAALERTSTADIDPQLRLEADARIIGSWVEILSHLVGQESARLPRPIS